MSLASNPLYVNLAAISADVRAMDFLQLEWCLLSSSLRQTVHDFWQLSAVAGSVNHVVEEFGLHVVVYRVDSVSKKLWVHLGAVAAVCYFLAIPFPLKVIRTLMVHAVSSARLRSSNSAVVVEADRLIELRMTLANLFQETQNALELTANEIWMRRVEEECNKLDLLQCIIALETDVICAQAFAVSR